MQIQDKAYVVTTNYSKLSVRMPTVLPMQKYIWLFIVPNAKTKTQLTLIHQIFHFEYKIQQNVTI